MTKGEILAKAIKTEEFNTTNAWGFGGDIGTRYYYRNGVVITIAKTYTRHRGGFSFTKVVAPYKGDDPNIVTTTVLDKSGLKLSDKQLEAIGNLIS